MRVFVLGDSLVHGLGDGENLGWVGRLPVVEDVQYFNLGVPGQTLSDILARAYHEITARIVPYHDNLIILAVTLNDLPLDEDDKMRTDPETLKAQMGALLDAMSHLAPVIVVGLTPVTEELNPYFVPAIGAERSWKNAVIELADQAYQTICKARDIPYLDLFDALKNDPSYLGSLKDHDGIHPETMGYIAMADYISNWKALRFHLPDANETQRK